jgi:hypothetical protein
MRSSLRIAARVDAIVITLDAEAGKPSAIPSHRHSSAIECPPQNPEITIRIFSSDEYCIQVLLRI